jgi:predicted dehydrogenase
VPKDSPNRREFLKAAGQASLTSLFTPSLFTPSLFTRSVKSANENVNVAFIGVGRRGSRNIAYAARVPGFQITAVCDVCQSALERAQAQSKRLGFDGVKARKDFREILADKAVDAVCIATTGQWHPHITVEACKAGKDVYVETPAFVYIEEGPKMVKAARKYQRVVQAGTIQRSGAAFQKAREIVQSGDLGDVTFCRGFFQGWGNGVHPIDTMQFAFDEAMPVSVTAQATPDTMLVTYRYPGFVGSYESRSASPHAMHNGTSFHGDKATLMVNRDGYGNSLTVAAPNGAARVSQWHCREGAGMNVAHWENFLECIRTRRRPIGDIETCVRSTATCVLASLAMRHNMTIEWDDRAFTVKQNEIRPYLKFNYRSPWKLEV